MSKMRTFLRFGAFLPALALLLLLPFMLFQIKDYTVMNRTKLEEISSFGDDFLHTEPLGTAESMALLCQSGANDGDNMVVIDNTGAYNDEQSERIFYNVCEEIANMQNFGAFPQVDVSLFDMENFDISTYIDISDTHRYVKVVNVMGTKGTEMFEAAMNLETNQIYHYSLRHPVMTKNTDVDTLLENFVDYLGMDWEVWYASQYPYSGGTSNTQSEVIDYGMSIEKKWLITSDVGVNLICLYFDETISIVLRPISDDTAQNDTKMMSN